MVSENANILLIILLIILIILFNYIWIKWHTYLFQNCPATGMQNGDEAAGRIKNIAICYNIYIYIHNNRKGSKEHLSQEMGHLLFQN